VKRKKIALSSERTLRECRRLGWDAGKVERFVKREGQPHGVRIDLFGWIDIIAVLPEDLRYMPTVLAIQSCSMSTRAAHLAKLAEPAIAERIRRWTRAGCLAELWAWRKRKVKRGGVAERWDVDRVRLGEAAQEPAVARAGG
jgi:hypothetical protein